MKDYYCGECGRFLFGTNATEGTVRIPCRGCQRQRLVRIGQDAGPTRIRRESGRIRILPGATTHPSQSA